MPAGGRWPPSARDHAARAAGHLRGSARAQSTRASSTTCACAGQRTVRRWRCGTAPGWSATDVWSRPAAAGRWTWRPSTRVPRPAELTLAVGAGDRERFAWLVEKSVELGATTVVPLETEHTARRREPAAPGAHGQATAPRAGGGEAERGRLGGGSRCAQGDRRISGGAARRPPVAGGRPAGRRRRRRSMPRPSRSSSAPKAGLRRGSVRRSRGRTMTA